LTFESTFIIYGSPPYTALRELTIARIGAVGSPRPPPPQICITRENITSAHHGEARLSTPIFRASIRAIGHVRRALKNIVVRLQYQDLPIGPSSDVSLREFVPLDSLPISMERVSVNNSLTALWVRRICVGVRRWIWRRQDKSGSSARARRSLATEHHYCRRAVRGGGERYDMSLGG
jgi:hypothetical protein